MLREIYFSNESSIDKCDYYVCLAECKVVAKRFQEESGNSFGDLQKNQMKNWLQEVLQLEGAAAEAEVKVLQEGLLLKQVLKNQLVKLDFE